MYIHKAISINKTQTVCIVSIWDKANKKVNTWQLQHSQHHGPFSLFGGHQIH